MSDLDDDAALVHSGRYPVLAFLCAAAAIAYVQRAAISVPARDIAETLEFTNVPLQMSYILSAWYMSYALMQLPSGWFADRIGSRRALAVLCALWSAVMLLCGFATDFLSLLILWSLMGAAQAGVAPCAVKAIGQIFPDTERARASGLLGSAMLGGGAVAPLLAGVLIVRLSPLVDVLHVDLWRLLFAAVAVLGFLWSIAFLGCIPAGQLPATRSSAEAAARVDWTRLFRSRSLALLCAQQFFRAAGMVFFLTWFPTFLQKTRGVSSLESGVLTTVAGVGGVLGSLCGGFVSDWMLMRTGNSRLSRQRIAVVGMAACSGLIVASYFVDDVRLSIVLIALGVFCATFGGVSGYPVAIQFGGRHVATVFGTMNMCGNIGAALFPVAAGTLVFRTGNWNLMLFLFAGIMAVDAVCWALLNPQGTLFGDADELR